MKNNDSLTNKFDFRIGKTYSFNDLPQVVKDDVEAQFDEYSEITPEDYQYVCVLLKPEDIEDYLFNTFGEYGVEDALNDPYMIKLINHIRKNGLDYPPVGIEGNHRALAFYYLRWDLPYLEMVLMNNDGD